MSSLSIASRSLRRIRLRKFNLCLLCSVFCLLCSFPVFAEQHGQLMFAGVPVPGATVTVTQGDKTLVTLTDEMGTYAFPDVTGGPFPIEIEMQGFAKLKGDTSTTMWELKMLTIEEIHAEVAHNEPPPPVEAAAGSGSTPAPPLPLTAEQRIRRIRRIRSRPLQ